MPTMSANRFLLMFAALRRCLMFSARTGESLAWPGLPAMPLCPDVDSMGYSLAPCGPVSATKTIRFDVFSCAARARALRGASMRDGLHVQAAKFRNALTRP